MIIFPVEIKKLLIGKLRDHFRITSGFVGIGCVRKQRIKHNPVQYTLQEPFERMAEKEIAYSIASDESEEDNTYLSYNKTTEKIGW